MTITDDHPLGAGVDGPVTARDTVDSMIEAGLLDHVMAQVDAGGLALTGDGGFLPAMIKAVLERGLAAEQTAHLGYERGDPAGRGTANSRNGATPKTLATEVGDIRLDVPRDRAGTFEPRLVPKGSRRSGGLDEMIALGGCAVRWRWSRGGRSRRGRGLAGTPGVRVPREPGRGGHRESAASRPASARAATQ